MRKLVLFFCGVLAASAAEDSWKKVQELKTGTEVRIYKRGDRQPIIATLDEATDDHIAFATKKEQTSLPKDDVIRVDARPAGAKRSISKETKTSESVDVPKPGMPSYPGERPGPSGNTSSNVSIGGKPDFETVYRKMPTLPAPTK